MNPPIKTSPNDVPAPRTGAIVGAPCAAASDALVLADGTRIRIRPIEPDDRDGLAELFARLSPRSRYRRFLAPKDELTGRELAYFSDVDHVGHEAVVAVDQRDGSIVGVARYVRVADRACAADLAVAVADDRQNRGIGTALVRRLVRRASANGFTLLTATTLWENRPARAILRRLRFHAGASRGREIGLELEIEPNERSTRDRGTRGRSSGGRVAEPRDHMPHPGRRVAPACELAQMREEPPGPHVEHGMDRSKRTRRRRAARIATSVAALAASLLVAVTATASAAPPGSTVLVSRPDGTAAAPAALDNASAAPLAVSADGRYVAFVSAADGFAPGADPRVANVFLRDTSTGTTTLVSRSDGLDGAGMNASAATGSEGTVGVAIEPGAQSPDAPHDRPHVLVVFATAATNLVDHASGSVPTGGVQQVWMRDVTAGTTYLVSRPGGGAAVAGDKDSRAPSITEGSHGPLIAFDTLAQNLGSRASGSVFMRDPNSDQTLLVSCPNRDCTVANPQSNQFSLHPSIQFVKGPQVTQCPDGDQCALVAFETSDTTITGESGASAGQIVLATALQGSSASSAFAHWVTVTTAAPNTGPAPFGNSESRLPMLGPDGQTVVYISNATNLAFPALAAGSGSQAYATIITSGSSGVSGIISGTTSSPQGATDVSVGGGAGKLIRFGFSSQSGQLSGPNPFGLSRAYTLLFDGTSRSQLLDSASGPTGVQGNKDSGAPAISADGSTAVFASRSTNLAAGGGIDFGRVYARRMATDQLELVSRPSGVGPFPTGVRASGIAGRAVSADGRYVAFQSQSDNLARGEDNRFEAVFVRDTLKGTTTLVSRASGANGPAANDDSTVGAISSDGRRVLFNTEAKNLGSDNPGSGAFVRDLDRNTTTVVSRANGADGTVVQGQGTDISGDGNRVVFVTTANLDPEASSDLVHVYVRDLAANRTIFVDRNTGAHGQSVDGIPQDASIDHDGQRVVWTSDERFAQVPTHIVVRLRDLQQNTTQVVSLASAPGTDPSAGEAANADADQAQIDARGDTVAFRSAATNLGTAVSHREIWTRNLNTGRTALASRAAGATGDPADADAQTPSLDDAGDRIAFISAAGNLGNPAPSSFDAHSYVRDLSTGDTQLVSRNNGAGGAPATHPGFTAVSLSGNGSCAAFSARSLTLGDGFASADFDSVHMRVLRGQCPPPGSGGSVGGSGSAVLSKLAVHPGKFRLKGRKRGTTISFRLSRSARVTLTFDRLVGGRRHAGRCAARTRKGRRCTISKRSGTLTIQNAHGGTNRVRFKGRLGRKTLTPGNYRLIAVPDGGQATTVRFTILTGRGR